MKKTETVRKKSSFQSIGMKRKLESVFLFVTGKCNAKCTMCFYAGEMEKKESDLTFEEMQKISETAGQFNRLWLSGGEPTLREDLPGILEMFYANNRIKDVNMPTNGLKPDRVVEWVERFRRNCPDCNITVSVSLDGFGVTHDTQRGVPGNFYKAVETLKKLNDRFGDDGRVIKNVSTVITRYNIAEVADFMLWIYGRFNTSTHTIEAARGMTRENGVKVLTENSLRELQDRVAPVYSAYAERMAGGVAGFRKKVTRFFYLGLIRALYDVRASNIDGPAPWGMDCTAGETTLVIDYDGRFRSCELRDPVGNIKEYGCDIANVLHSDAMRSEIGAVGHGYGANCWCTHGCWIMSSIVFNPSKMVSKVFRGYREMKKLNRPFRCDEALLRELEDKYRLDVERLHSIGIISDCTAS